MCSHVELPHPVVMFIQDMMADIIFDVPDTTGSRTSGGQGKMYRDVFAPFRMDPHKFSFINSTISRVGSFFPVSICEIYAWFVLNLAAIAA